MSYNARSSKQLLGGNEVSKLKSLGLVREEEYAFVEGDVVIAENVKTQDKRVLGKASELLAESGSKRILKG